MFGGAKYNSLGVAGIGVGNIVDSLAVIKYMVFDQKICTGQELYDAVIGNWEGKEELRQYVLNKCPHFGNDDEYVDQFAGLVSDKFQEFCVNTDGYRCKMRPGLWPVTMNVLFGFLTHASFDGRKAGMPLSDGISPVQSLDKNGPTAILKSVVHIDQSKLGNGTLLNMRFHPTVIKQEGGVEKLSQLIKTYFDMGGMQMQINVTSTETLRDAQAHPENHKDLVVRVAGFSVYFVELFKGSQDDVIARTELIV
jgi:formate C-acetyltransferase